MNLSRGLAKAHVSVLAGAEEGREYVSLEAFPGAGLNLGLRILQRRWGQTRGQPQESKLTLPQNQ